MGSAHRAGWFIGEEKVLKIDGAFAPRVLRFDSGFAAEGCGIAAFGGDEYICCLWYRKPYNRPGGRGKTSKPPFRAMEMHPYSRCAGLPPEGEVLETLCLQVLMKPKANLRANLPLRGRCRRQKGCISIERSSVVWFSIPRSGITKLIARQGDTTTL